MTVTDFLRHWGLAENPFMGEEARADDVFARMGGQAGAPMRSGEEMPARSADLAAYHADFDKIVGDLRRPSAAVAFGEKGSGKTAIRLQLERRVQEYNAANVGAKVLFVAYDDLNASLDRLHDRLNSKTPLESLQKLRLVDHLDAILHAIVPRLVDAIMGEGTNHGFVDVGDVSKIHKRIDKHSRRDLLLLQALYDYPEVAPVRTARLRGRLRLLPPAGAVWGRLTLILVPLLLLALWWWTNQALPSANPALAWLKPTWAAWGLVVLVGFYAIFALKHGVWDRLALLRQAHRVKRQIRVVSRGDISYASSLKQLPTWFRDAAHLPLSDSDEPRFGMLDRVRRFLRHFGYAGIMVVIDRVDEPTIVNGDPDRMKAVVWPLLNNKFLQQEGVGVKMLLPMELRHAVFKESSAFFQGARLDKQSLVERLSWTGSTLYDLCEQRLHACRQREATPLPLLGLFTEDVSRQDLTEALERLHQPRDAFKLMYRCINDHCASVTRGQEEWRIPRLTLLNVLKAESERVQQMHRGIRP